jgi:hypothetical protein
MPGAQIVFNQVGNPIPYGTPGVARDDIWQSNPVVCQSTLSGNVTYQWQFLDLPPGSGASFTGGNTATATFTPDLLGTYRIQLTTNGGGLGNVMILVIRVRYNNVGELINDGICLPAFGERVGEDNILIPPVSGPQNVRGYAPFFESLLAYILTFAPSPPFEGNSDEELTVVDGVNDWVLVSATIGTLTVEDGGLTASATIQMVDYGSFQIAVYNDTAYPLYLQGYNDVSPIGPIPVGGVGLWVQVTSFVFSLFPTSILLLPSASSLTDPVIVDGTTFLPASTAPDTVNQSSALIESYQLNSNSPVATLVIPLPGTAGNPVALGTPGLFTLDVAVRMQSNSTVDSAWFKLTWAWSVQSSGSPQSLGAAALTPLSIGNSVATPQTAPVGWLAALVLDGPQQNVVVTLTGDPSLIVDCSVQAEWNSLQ